MADSPKARPDVPARTRAAIYGAGMFSNSMTDVASVVLPLWLAGLGYSTAAIGLVVGAKHFLPLLFAIHGGAVIDRIGARRVMLVTAATSVAVLPLFPVYPVLVVIVALQMLNGFATAMSWIGAQSLFGRVLHGHPDYAGPFSFALRLGSFIGPPLGGLAFDTWGIAGGVAVLVLWAAMTFASAWVLPPSGRSAQKRVEIADLVPRIDDYRAAFNLMWMPAMATVLSITVFRIGAASIQDSFYPIFLGSIGFPATQIGILITISSALGAVSALSVGWLTRRIDGLWLLIGSTMGAIVFIAATPLFTAYWMLVVMAVLRGICMGISQPLMLSLLVSAAERKEQGLGVSLRTTANRVAAAVTPMTMGLVAGAVGLASSFLVMGAVLIAGMVVVARNVLRRRGSSQT